MLQLQTSPAALRQASWHSGNMLMLIYGQTLSCFLIRKWPPHFSSYILTCGIYAQHMWSLCLYPKWSKNKNGERIGGDLLTQKPENLKMGLHFQQNIKHLPHTTHTPLWLFSSFLWIKSTIYLRVIGKKYYLLKGGRVKDVGLWVMLENKQNCK